MTTKRESSRAWIGLSVIGGIAILISILGALHDPRDFFQTYLFSFLFWSDLPLGALPLVMIYHLTGGTWGAATRRILEAISDTILAIAILSIPVLVGLHRIYPWTDASVASDPKILHKHLYLNPASFCVRTILYFVAWGVLNHFLQRDAEGERKGAPIALRARLRNLSAGGVVLAGFLSTFASIDWQMSVEPKWYSTIYGMVYGTGQALTAYSFCLMVFAVRAREGAEPPRFQPKTLWDIGNILLTLVMVWTYLSFMQYLIVWSGNKPDEVIWYNHRTGGGWQWLALILFLFQFSAPFLLLLFRSSKRDPARLAALGAMVFGARIVDHYWSLFPGLRPERFEVPWETLTTWIGVGGLWLAVFLKRLQSRPAFATQDPDWELAKEVRYVG